MSHDGQSIDVGRDHFLQRGYLVLPPGVNSSLHATIRAKALAIASQGPEATWRLGDDVLLAIPELRQVIELPQVRSALTSVLGEHYILHGHRHLHTSSEHDQMWHKDSYWGFRLVRRHRPRMCMMLYYPQETTLNMGPTHVLAGSQYWTVNTEGQASNEDILRPADGSVSMFAAGSQKEREAKLLEAQESLSYTVEDVALTVPAGSCVLMHYDLFHRGSARHSATPRFMVKLQFLRTTEPVSCACRPEQSKPSTQMPIAHMTPILQDMRAWLGLQAAETTEAPPDDALSSSCEAIRIAAAYCLGRSPNWHVLLSSMVSDQEAASRAAAYGLSACPRAANALCKLLPDKSTRVRRLAAFALGECAQPDSNVIHSIGQALKVEDKQSVLVELLLGLSAIASRARSLGDDLLCAHSVSLVVPYLKPTMGRSLCVLGESASMVVLAAGGSTASVSSDILRALVPLMSPSSDRYTANIASEILRRHSLATQVAHLSKARTVEPWIACERQQGLAVREVRFASVLWTPAKNWSQPSSFICCSKPVFVARTQEDTCSTPTRLLSCSTTPGSSASTPAWSASSLSATVSSIGDPMPTDDRVPVAPDVPMPTWASIR